MKYHAQHSWDLSPKEAVQLQKELRNKVLREDTGGSDPNLVAGTDVGFEENYTITRAAVAVLSFPALELQEYTIARMKTTFPYVPGLLSFREIPCILKALTKLNSKPDLILCDGQGIAHPRRLGLASHLGVVTDLPTIGVAKSRFIGTHTKLGIKKGAHVPLMDGDEQIGVVLRSRDNVKPLFVSLGHRVSLPTAISVVMQCLTKYRLPETTRWAHKLASTDFDEAEILKLKSSNQQGKQA